MQNLPRRHGRREKQEGKKGAKMSGLEKRPASVAETEKEKGRKIRPFLFATLQSYTILKGFI
jgi:hypothetical protein